MHFLKKKEAHQTNCVRPKSTRMHGELNYIVCMWHFAFLLLSLSQTKGHASERQLRAREAPRGSSAKLEVLRLQQLLNEVKHIRNDNVVSLVSGKCKMNPPPSPPPPVDWSSDFEISSSCFSYNAVVIIPPGDLKLLNEAKSVLERQKVLIQEEFGKFTEVSLKGPHASELTEQLCRKFLTLSAVGSTGLIYYNGYYTDEKVCIYFYIENPLCHTLFIPFFILSLCTTCLLQFLSMHIVCSLLLLWLVFFFKIIIRIIIIISIIWLYHLLSPLIRDVFLFILMVNFAPRLFRSLMQYYDILIIVFLHSHRMRNNTSPARWSRTCRFPPPRVYSVPTSTSTWR